MKIDIENLSISELEEIIKRKRMNEKPKNLKSNKWLINKFIENLNSIKTKQTYFYALNQFLKFINYKNLQLITKLDLENYFNYLNNSNNFKKNTKRLKYAGVVSFYQYFFHLQDIDKNNSLNLYFIENPISNIKRNWKNDKEIKKVEILTNNEIKKILIELKKINYRYYLIFYILADTSMRVNGLSNVEIQNINFNRRTIKTFDKGKNRIYMFGEKIKRELQFYINNIRPNINCINKNSEYLFFSKKYKKLFSSNIFSHIFPKISKIIYQLTNKKITAHDLRRSFKTNRTNLGQLREQVEALMNHKQGLDNAYNRPTHKMLLSWFDKYEEL